VGGLPKMTPKDAKRYARLALERRFRQRFKQGTNRKNDCSRKSPTRFSCKVSWRRGDARFKGTVKPSYVRKSGTVSANTPIDVEET
jgi:hypothetical protein